ncbi:ATP-dependent helicase BRM [Tanacetum coccineum]
MPGNSMRQPMQNPQAQQSIQYMENNNAALAMQIQAMQAMALERNIDLSLPQNAHMIAQLMQSIMLGQQKVNESNMGPQQQVTSPQLASESCPRSDASGHSGSTKARRAMSPGHLGSTSNTFLVNNSGTAQGQQQGSAQQTKKES